jgi:hypothetical protein
MRLEFIRASAASAISLLNPQEPLSIQLPPVFRSAYQISLSVSLGGMRLMERIAALGH